MAIDREQLLERVFAPVEEVVTPRDCMLYALSVGFGRNPVDSEDLPFVYEKALEVFPSMAVVLGHPGKWMQDAGINYKMVVHGSQRLTMHRPIPVNEKIVSSNRVVEVLDKGPGRGAIVITERIIRDARGELIASMESGVFCRADGGFGGPREGAYVFGAVPDREADVSVSFPTEPDAALLYRLNGDYNPLHADPELAAVAGFQRPILHGLCTFGMVGVALQRKFGNAAGARLKSLEARFSKPVLPGETVTLDVWRENAELRFRAKTPAGIVLDSGMAKF